MMMNDESRTYFVKFGFQHIDILFSSLQRFSAEKQNIYYTYRGNYAVVFNMVKL